MDLISAPDIPQREITEFDAGSFFPGLIVSSINPAVEAELNLPWGIKGLAVLERACCRLYGDQERGYFAFAQYQDLEKAKDIDAILSSGDRGWC